MRRTAILRPALIAGFVSVLLLAFAAVSLAQKVAWTTSIDVSRTFTDQPRTFVLAPSGDIYFTGQASDTTTLLVKMDAQGNMVWSQTLSNWSPLFAALDGAGNIVIAGAGGNAMVAAKFDSAGNQLWFVSHKQAPDRIEWVNSAAVTGDGSSYLTGYSELMNPDYTQIIYREAVVLRVDPDGNVTWVKANAGDHSSAGAVTTDAGGNAYAAVNFYWSDIGAYQTRLVRYSPTGDQVWAVAEQLLVGQSTGWAALTIDPWGNLYAVGWTTSPGSAVAARYDLQGNELWVRTYQSTEQLGDRFRYVAVDSQGNIHVTGLSAGTTGHVAFILSKYAPNGDTLWFVRREWPGGGALVGGPGLTASAVGTAGDLAIAGYDEDPNGVYSYFTLRYDSQGREVWLTPFVDANGAPANVAVDSGGAVYSGGTTLNQGFRKRLTVVKYYNPPLYGHVDLEQCLNPANLTATIQFRDPSTGQTVQTSTVPLTSLYTYQVADAPTGTWDVALKTGNWLRTLQRGVQIDGSGIALDFSCLNGDANNHNRVDLLDLSLVLSQFGSMGSGLAGDLNRDGRDNLLDLSIVLQNFLKTGDP